MLRVKRWLPTRELMIVADSSFAALELLAAVTQRSLPVHVITRLRLDAARSETALVRQLGTMGRPRLKGARLANLEQVLLDPKTQWQTVTLKRWYAAGEREVEIHTGTALWDHTGLPVAPIRWVLVRDLPCKFSPQAFLCTNQAHSPKQILEWFGLYADGKCKSLLKKPGQT